MPSLFISKQHPSYINSLLSTFEGRKVSLSNDGSATIVDLHESQTQSAMHTLAERGSNRIYSVSIYEKDPTVLYSNSGNLIVKNIPSFIGHADIFNVFSQVGPLFSMKYPRFNESTQDPSHAWVRYINAEDADRALNTLNESTKTLNGKEWNIVVEKANDLEKPLPKNIFVKSLPATITLEEFSATLASYGPIDTNLCSVKKVSVNGTESAHGYCLFTNAEDAKKAIIAINSTKPFGEDASACYHLAKHIRARNMALGYQYTKQELASLSRDRNVIISGFEATTTDADVLEMCREYGEVSSLSKNQRRPFGQYFVVFKEQKDAQLAVEGLSMKPGLTAAIVKPREELARQPPQYGTHRTPRRFHDRYQSNPRGYPRSTEKYDRRAKNVPPPVDVQEKPFEASEVVETFEQEKQRFVEQLRANNINEQDKKEELGERLFTIIEGRNKGSASQLTGMILQLELEEVIRCYLDEDYLDSTLNEALAVLQQQVQ
ncbi:hypothetical protein RCL1_001422 [Eukaryota sp. TZLM3-RCL]